MIDILSSVTDITPEFPLPLSGYADLKTQSQGSHSRLEANIIQIASGESKFILIAVDTLFVGTSMKQGLLNYLLTHGLEINNKQLHLYSSHTHTAPSLDSDKPALGIFSQDYLDQCVVTIGDAVLSMCKSASTQATSFAQGKAVCDSSVYRRIVRYSRVAGGVRYSRQLLMAPNSEVEINQTIQTLVLYDERNNPLACFWTWPCHPIAAPGVNRVSSDFPGAMRHEIRTVLKQADMPVIYFPGFAGDIRPDFIQSNTTAREFLSSPFTQFFADSSPQRFKEICTGLADSIQTALSSSTKTLISESDFRFNEKTLPLTELIDDYAGAHPTLDVCHITAGPLKILSINAEVCSPYYQAWQVDDDVFATGYTSSTFGYLPTDDQISHGGYEVDGFFTCFSIRGHFKSAIDQSVQRLVQDVLDQASPRN